jgi:hypothetical protein
MRTPPLERLKSRKFSISLGRLPEILTGKKTEDDKEKDGSDPVSAHAPACWLLSSFNGQ